MHRSYFVRTESEGHLLGARVDRLMTIPAIGHITALTWVLEVGEVERFHSVKQVISY